MWKSISVIILMNGLKIQWGEVSTGNDVTKTFDFSSLGLLSFTTYNYKAVFTQKKTTQNRYDANVFIISQTPAGMTIRGQNDKGAYIRRQRIEGRSKLSLAKEFGVTWVTLNKFMIKNKIQ